MTIEEYLAALRRHLRAGPLAKRRILREIEAHLRDAVEEETQEAERRAIAGLGSPEEISTRFPQTGVPTRLAVAAGVGALVVAGGVAVTVGLIVGSTPRNRIAETRHTPLIDVTLSPGQRSCFEGYLRSPTRIPLSMIRSATAIEVRKRGTIRFTFGSSAVGAPAGTVDLVVPCNGIGPA